MPKSAEDIRQELYEHYVQDDYDYETPIEEVAKLARQKYEANRGVWSNPQEFSDARVAYALDGDKEGIQERWDESINLLDPASQKAYEFYGRDADFLEALAKAEKMEDVQREYPVGLGDKFGGNTDFFPKMVDVGDKTKFTQEAIDRYNRPTRIGRSYDTENVLQTITDNETGVGHYLNKSGIVPNALRIYFGGEGEGDGSFGSNLMDSFDQAYGLYENNRRTRASQPAPIGDIDSGATPAERIAAYQALRKQNSQVQPPDARTRWKRQGYDVPYPVAFASDLLLDMADPSILAAGMTGLGKTAATGVLRGLAGKSVARPIIQGAKQMLTKEGLKTPGGSNFARNVVKGTAAAGTSEAIPEVGVGVPIDVAVGVPYLQGDDREFPEFDKKIADERRAMNQKGLSFEAPYQEAYDKQVLPEINKGKSYVWGRQPAIPRY